MDLGGNPTDKTNTERMASTAAHRRQAVHNPFAARAGNTGSSYRKFGNTENRHIVGGGHHGSGDQHHHHGSGSSRRGFTVSPVCVVLSFLAFMIVYSTLPTSQPTNTYDNSRYSLLTTITKAPVATEKKTDPPVAIEKDHSYFGSTGRDSENDSDGTGRNNPYSDAHNSDNGPVVGFDPRDEADPDRSFSPPDSVDDRSERYGSWSEDQQIPDIPRDDENDSENANTSPDGPGLEIDDQNETTTSRDAEDEEDNSNSTSNVIGITVTTDRDTSSNDNKDDEKDMKDRVADDEQDDTRTHEDTREDEDSTDKNYIGASNEDKSDTTDDDEDATGENYGEKSNKERTDVNDDGQDTTHHDSIDGDKNKDENEEDGSDDHDDVGGSKQNGGDAKDQGTDHSETSDMDENEGDVSLTGNNTKVYSSSDMKDQDDVDDVSSDVTHVVDSEDKKSSGTHDRKYTDTADVDHGTASTTINGITTSKFPRNSTMSKSDTANVHDLAEASDVGGADHVTNRTNSTRLDISEKRHTDLPEQVVIVKAGKGTNRTNTNSTRSDISEKRHTDLPEQIIIVKGEKGTNQSNASALKSFDIVNTKNRTAAGENATKWDLEDLAPANILIASSKEPNTYIAFDKLEDTVSNISSQDDNKSENTTEKFMDGDDLKLTSSKKIFKEKSSRASATTASRMNETIFVIHADTDDVLLAASNRSDYVNSTGRQNTKTKNKSKVRTGERRRKSDATDASTRTSNASDEVTSSSPGSYIKSSARTNEEGTIAKTSKKKSDGTRKSLLNETNADSTEVDPAKNVKKKKAGSAKDSKTDSATDGFVHKKKKNSTAETAPIFEPKTAKKTKAGLRGTGTSPS